MLPDNQLEYEGQTTWTTNDTYFQDKQRLFYIFSNRNNRGYGWLFIGIGKVISQSRPRIKNKDFSSPPKWILQIDNNQTIIDEFNDRLKTIHSSNNNLTKYVNKLSVFNLLREHGYTHTKKNHETVRSHGIVNLEHNVNQKPYDTGYCKTS
jgi:hypothetical protein